MIVGSICPFCQQQSISNQGRCTNTHCDQCFERVDPIPLSLFPPTEKQPLQAPERFTG